MIKEVRIENVVHQVTVEKEFLFCVRCHAKWSAAAEDYPGVPNGQKFLCKCGAELILARDIASTILDKNSPMKKRDLRRLKGG